VLSHHLTACKQAGTDFTGNKPGQTYDAVAVLDDTGQYVNFKLEFPADKKTRPRK